MKNSIIKTLLLASFISFGFSTVAGAKLDLTGCGAFLEQAKLSKSELNMSQAARLEALFKSLPESEISKLFELLKQHNLTDLISRLETGQVNSATAKLFEEHPEFAALMLDLAKFGDTFPGIFELQNAQIVTLQVLGTIRNKEGKNAKNVTNGDLLQSQSMAPQLKWTINSTIANLIQQAVLEYKGFDFNKPFFQRMWEKTKRYMFPSYAKVWRVIDLAQDYQRQLQRLAVVDRLIIDLALGNARQLGLTQEEMASLTFQILNSPEEIKSLEKESQNLFGGRFAIGKAGATGEFDIFASNAVAQDVNQAEMFENFDVENLKALDLLNQALNAARERKGEKKITIHEVDSREIQLRAEASVRRRSLYESRYRGRTAQDTDETYTVEDRREHQEKTGEDKDGKPTYKTVVTYHSRSVTPSFEDILSNSFDKGDRFVSGLDDIIERASKMVKIESEKRNFVANVEEFYDQLLQDYQEILNGRGREKAEVIKEIAALVTKLEAQIKKQIEYAGLNAQQIRQNYSEDILENFKGRNLALLARMENMQAGLLHVSEALNRNLRNLFPTYDLFDFTNWTLELKSYRNWNYAYKMMQVGTFAATTSWWVSPQIQRFVGIHRYEVVNWVQSTIQSLTSGVGM